MPLRAVLCAVLLAVLATGAAACDDGGGDDQVAARPSRFVPTAPVTGLGTVGLDCAATADGLAEPPPGDYVVLDAVAVPPGHRELGLLGPSGSATGNRRFAAYGLVVRTGEGVELSVPADAAERPAIAWGNVGEPVSVITIAPCPRRADGRAWQAFTGGFYAEHPMCVPLTVRTAGRETTVGIAVGMPCR
ncbi:hypothetical protein [Yinghuangia sp. YIM S09857]|uniref:hypothetical protein n=1 Tax=Yinghuangia sp. YIM S09857 TaxID=3436929 RepID=UPI003F53AD4B